MERFAANQAEAISVRWYALHEFRRLDISVDSKAESALMEKCREK